MRVSRPWFVGVLVHPGHRCDGSIINVEMEDRCLMCESKAVYCGDGILLVSQS